MLLLQRVILTHTQSGTHHGTLEDYGRRSGFVALKLELSRDWGWLGIHRMERFSYEALYPVVGQLLAEEYPCREALGLIHYAYGRLGASKLLWGAAR